MSHHSSFFFFHIITIHSPPHECNKQVAFSFFSLLSSFPLFFFPPFFFFFSLSILVSSDKIKIGGRESTEKLSFENEKWQRVILTNTHKNQSGKFTETLKNKNRNSRKLKDKGKKILISEQKDKDLEEDLCISSEYAKYEKISNGNSFFDCSTGCKGLPWWLRG